MICELVTKPKESLLLPNPQIQKGSEARQLLSISLERGNRIYILRSFEAVGMVTGGIRLGGRKEKESMGKEDSNWRAPRESM